MPTQKRHFHNPPLPATVDSVQAIDKGLIKFDQLKAYVTKHVTGTKGGPNTVSVVTPGVLRVLFVNRNKDYLFQITRTYINSLGLKKVICLEPNDCSGAYHMRVLENRIAQKKPSSTHPTVGRATKSGTAASGHPMSSGTPRHGSSSLPAVSDIISAAMSHSLQSVASASSSTAATYSASRVAGTTGVATTATPAVRSSPAAPMVL
ncbi:uncharacterized protein LOC135828872 [Sycon ciliatum]|uniref:uncharacterized protein LOC135828872 n=1 Tax=Sycon ciliatum TaxID=27933 RepID=UPI0031F67067